MADPEVVSTAKELSGLEIEPRGPPIHSLSTDTVYCIFLACLPDAPARFSTTASHVCRSWRSLALKANTLWTNLVFDRNRRSIEKNAAWVERSGQALLDVEIRNEVFRKASVKTAACIIRLLKPESHRIRTLNVGDDLPPKVFRLIFDEFTSVILPQLLEIRIENNSWAYRWRPEISAGGAPRLERLSTRNYLFDWASPVLRNLRALRITLARNFSPNDSLIILNGAPHLQSLILRMGDNLQPEWNQVKLSTPIESRLVSHDSLVYLYLSNRIFYHLITHFRFPSLKNLDYLQYRGGQLSPGRTPPLDKLLPRLEYLKLHVDCNVNPHDTERKIHDVLAGYATIGTITTIELSGMSFEDTEGRVHTLGGLGRLFPPNLDTLVIYGCLTGYTLAPLREMVASRMDVDGVSPIQRLSLTIESKSVLRAVRRDADLRWLKSNVPGLHIGPYDPMIGARSYWGSV